MLLIKKIPGDLRGEVHVHPLFRVHLILVPVADKHMGRGIRGYASAPRILASTLKYIGRERHCPVCVRMTFGYELL